MSKKGFAATPYKGDAHWKYRGGRAICNGYESVMVKGHPFANAKGYVFEHRLIVEKSIGRYLQPNERVHHIDGDKTNNSIENLIVLTHKEHRRIHKTPTAKWELLENIEWLKEQLKKNISISKISKAIGCSHDATSSALEAHGIREIPRGPQKLLYPCLNDKSWLSEKTATLPTRQIAKLLGCSQGLVSRYQKKFELKSLHKPGLKRK